MGWQLVEGTKPTHVFHPKGPFGLFIDIHYSQMGHGCAFWVCFSTDISIAFWTEVRIFPDPSFILIFWVFTLDFISLLPNTFPFSVRWPYNQLGNGMTPSPILEKFPNNHADQDQGGSMSRNTFNNWSAVRTKQPTVWRLGEVFWRKFEIISRLGFSSRITALSLFPKAPFTLASPLYQMQR